MKAILSLAAPALAAALLGTAPGARAGELEPAGHGHAGHDPAGHDRAGHRHSGNGHAGHGHGVPTPRPSIYDAGATLQATRTALPPPPAGTADLTFRELLAPAGRRGLAYTAKARALDGSSVRMLGYMVRQDLPAAGMLLLAPYPLQLHETEYGLAEDLPAATVHVVVPDRKGQQVPYTPGLLLLTGRLELGPREEPDGRVSTARLVLHPGSAASAAGAQHAPTKQAPKKEEVPR